MAAIPQFKILIVGPVGAGKTTAVATLSDKEALSTDVAVSDMTRLKKAHTTVALDYGVLTLETGERIHLYGAPGQQRFEFMWEVLREGIDGLILLIDNSRRSPLEDLSFYLQWHQSCPAAHKTVVGVSFMDKASRPGLIEYRNFLATRGLDIPVLAVDTRRRGDVKQLVQTLLF